MGWFCLELGRQIKQWLVQKKGNGGSQFFLLLFLKNIGKCLCFLMKSEAIPSSAYAHKEIISMERLGVEYFLYLFSVVPFAGQLPNVSWKGLKVVAHRYCPQFGAFCEGL